jgi:MFS family permease
VKVGAGEAQQASDAAVAAAEVTDRPPHFYVRLLSALYFSTFCIRLSFGMFIVAFPDYVDVDATTLGILWAASPLFELFSVLFIGAIIDRYGRKRVLIFGLLLGMLSLVTLVLTKNAVAIFIINGFHGVSSGCIIVSSLALMADYVKPESRGRAIGVFDGVNIFGWASGFFLGGVFLHLLEPRIGLVFVVAGGFAILGAVYAWFNISEPERKSFLVKQLSLSHFREVLRQRSLLYLALTWLVVYVLVGSLLAHAKKMGGALELSDFETGALMGGVCVVILATQRFFGSLSDRFGRTPIMSVGVLGLAGAMIIVCIGIVSAHSLSFSALKAELEPWLPVIGLFLLLAMAFPPAALAALADDAHEKRRGITMGVFALAMAAGMSVGPPSVGWVSDRIGPEGVFVYVMVVLVLITTFMVLRARALRRGE